MARNLDLYTQRIIHNAVDNRKDGQAENHHYTADQIYSTNWGVEFPPGQDGNLAPSSDVGPVSFEYQPCFFPGAITNINRFSFAPRNLYKQRELQPKTIVTAENDLRIAQNLHRDVALNQTQERSTNFRTQDTVGQLESIMLLQYPTTLPRFEPERGFHSTCKTRTATRSDQFQTQRQQVALPFNLDTNVYNKIHSSAVSSSSSIHPASSPIARISLRRERALPVPRSQLQRTEPYSDEDQAPAHITPRQYASISSTNMTQALTLGHAPPMAHGIQLVSPYELPDRFRTNKNVIVSAPTGSGKTALLELAICKLLEDYPSERFKIVYQAPTKSLCSERLRDWQKKFSHLNLPCAELTGDTNQSEMGRVRSASIIVTTPEKWDSITRKWSDHSRLVRMVRLFLIDEVHILKDIRGSTLEVVVSRMKTMGANVRFIALSATVPNSEDIATWLGQDHTSQHLPAHRETFGEDYRPVKLQKHIHGFDSICNDFAFEKVLDGKLPTLLQRYTHKKPIMIFCFTRKSCERTASILAEWWIRQRVYDRAWPAPLQGIAVESKELQNLVKSGVAFHHAGLDAQDRQAIETGYLMGDVNVICCTSTLAVGINLPCHMVILKGTVGFQDGILGEYSDLEVMQMLGRAGRPQFDTSAVAIIMTRSNKADHYKKMISGQDILESSLHLNLIEHLNSEISLGLVKDLNQAKSWITKTFLSVRMRQNPKYYLIAGGTEAGNIDEGLKNVCARDIRLLQEHKIVTREEHFTCTEYGEAMCRYMVQFETMKLLLSIPRKATTEQILTTICEAVEFKDFRMKPGERHFLRKLNKSPFIRFPIDESVTTAAHKVSLIIQVQLGAVDISTEMDFASMRRQFSTDKDIIFERIQRLVRCLVDCKMFDSDSVSTRHALELSRSLSAGYWDNSNLELRQIPQVGPVAHSKFISAGVNTVVGLAEKDTASIERILSKNPPFGKKLKDTLACFPRLRISSEITHKIPYQQGVKPMVHVKASLSFQNEKIPIWNHRKPSLTFMAETYEGSITHFWRGNILKLEKGFDLKFTVQLSRLEEQIQCWVACEDIVGTFKSCILRHAIPVSEFLLMNPQKKLQQNSRIKAKNITLLDFSDEFGCDDLEDDELLEAVQRVEKPASEYGSDDFADIDNLEFDSAVTIISRSKIPQDEQEHETESIQMNNGKWTCQHDCHRGLRKNGQTCKHRCCHEGVDKPSKQKRMSSSTKSRAAIKKGDAGSDYEQQTRQQFVKPSSSDKSRFDLDNVEIIDLAVEPSVSFSDSAPTGHTKLYGLDPNFHKEESIRYHSKLKTQFPYAADLNTSFPDGHTEAGLNDVYGSKDSDLELQLPSETIIKRSFGKDLESSDDSDSLFEQETRGLVLDASIVGFQEKGVALGSPLSPITRTSSSIAKEKIELDALPSNFDIEEDLTECSWKTGRNSGQDGGNVTKRQRSDSPEVYEVKCRRVSKTKLTPIHNDSPVVSTPAWVKEIDSDLIEEFKSFVDFVD